MSHETHIEPHIVRCNINVAVHYDILRTFLRRNKHSVTGLFRAGINGSSALPFSEFAVVGAGRCVGGVYKVIREQVMRLYQAESFGLAAVGGIDREAT